MVLLTRKQLPVVLKLDLILLFLGGGGGDGAQLTTFMKHTLTNIFFWQIEHPVVLWEASVDTPTECSFATWSHTRAYDLTCISFQKRSFRSCATQSNMNDSHKPLWQFQIPFSLPVENLSNPKVAHDRKAFRPPYTPIRGRQRLFTQITPHLPKIKKIHIPLWYSG